MMSFTELERQALGSIADGLAGSDPRLASMLTIFSRLAAGEEMPVREKTRVRRGWPAAHRPRRARRHPRRGIAFPQPRRLYVRLGWQQAMLLLGIVISAALLTAALALITCDHETCVRSMASACRAPSIPQHAGRANNDALRGNDRRSGKAGPPGGAQVAAGARAVRGPLPYRLALPVCQQAGPGRPLGGRRVGLAAYVACSACGRSADAGPGG